MLKTLPCLTFLEGGKRVGTKFKILSNMKNNFESLNLSKFQSAQISKSSLLSITGGVEYTEGGKSVGPTGSGFSYQGDRVYTNAKGKPVISYSGFQCISGGVVSGTAPCGFNVS
jgi:hypothetical protein